MVVIWARNLETKQINAFVVRKGNPGYKTGKIEKKIALRCVQNADIEMEGCVVPDSARLPGVNSFQVSKNGMAIQNIRRWGVSPFYSVQPSRGLLCGPHQKHRLACCSQPLGCCHL